MPVSDLLRRKRQFVQWLYRFVGLSVQYIELPTVSKSLQRTVTVDVYRTAKTPNQPLFIFLDGQDVRRMPVNLLQRQLTRREGFPAFTVVGVHADAGRMQEYGTFREPDYANRGRRAAHTGRFIVEELLPLLRERYAISSDTRQTCVAGFSLGALVAFDLAWYYPDHFGVAGIFSGALWWRSQPFAVDRPDADRILHTRVEQAKQLPPVRYWFQAGTDDETEDRNQNGIIDAIDDTLQLMDRLRAKGQAESDLYYHEVPGGRHEPITWGAALIYFFRWALRD